jgi:hypothetical protein
MKSAALLLILLGQLHVSVSVPPTGFLGVVQASSGVEHAGTVVKVHGGGDAWVSFIARSNTSYRLRAKALRVRGTGQSGIRLKAESVVPAGNGSRLMTDALRMESKEVEIDSGSEDIVVASGPRISRDGNNSILDNAIVLRVRVDLPEGVAEADLRFELALGK